MITVLRPQPRPKLLSVITVPTGGWTIKIYLSKAGPGQFGVPVTADMAAGDYFLADDRQTSCFLYELNLKLQAAIIAAGAPFDTNSEVMTWIDSDHKVHILFDGTAYGVAAQRDIKIAWTEEDGDEIGPVLGFDHTADDSVTGSDNPAFVGDYHHAYGWYSDEDGSLAEDAVEDEDNVNALQSIAPSGHAKTHYIGSAFQNRFALQQIPHDKIWSQDIGYTAAPVYPYNRNEPLQCWWKEARQGKRFRVYRDGQIDTNRSIERGLASGGTTIQLTDATKTWGVEPFRWPGRILHIEDSGNVGADIRRWYISANATTTLAVLASPEGYDTDEVASTPYYIFEQPYRTYWLDQEASRVFKPTELPHINRFDFTMHLLKYEA